MSEPDVNVRFSEAEARALIDALYGERLVSVRRAAYRRAKAKLEEAHKNRAIAAKFEHVEYRLGGGYTVVQPK